MKRKMYDCPTTEVVRLENQARLLNGSGNIDASRAIYGEAFTETWE